jgi:hypothetical protein
MTTSDALSRQRLTPLLGAAVTFPIDTAVVVPQITNRLRPAGDRGELPRGGSITASLIQSPTGQAVLWEEWPCRREEALSVCKE